MRVCVAAVAAAVSMWAAPALAADFTFTFDDEATAFLFGREHVDGTISGILYGLTDTGFSGPTGIAITEAPSELGVALGLFNPLIDYLGGTGFRVQNGVIISANAQMNIWDSAGGEYNIRFNYSEANTADINAFIHNGNQPIYRGVGNDNGFGGVTFALIPDSVPEPGTWALMLLGFGSMGWMLRRQMNPICSMRPVVLTTPVGASPTPPMGMV
jgi:hypothetical protein